MCQTFWTESGSGSNGGWVTRVGIKGEVDDVGGRAPVSFCSGNIFWVEDSLNSPDCANWSGVTKDEDGDCEGLKFKPIKEDTWYGTDWTGSTGIESETGLLAISASFMLKSWRDEGNEFIISSLWWDGRNACLSKDDGISREVENWTGVSEGENFGCTDVEVEDEDTGTIHSDASVKLTVVDAWMLGDCSAWCAVKRCDIGEGACTVNWFSRECEMPIDVPLCNIAIEKDWRLVVWVIGGSSNGTTWLTDWFKPG